MPLTEASTSQAWRSVARASKTCQGLSADPQRAADQPYEKLKRALRAEVDPDAWASLYLTTSRPFPKPGIGKIAVKAINHCRDEVLKVFEV